MGEAERMLLQAADPGEVETEIRIGARLDDPLPEGILHLPGFRNLQQAREKLMELKRQTRSAEIRRVLNDLMDLLGMDRPYFEEMYEENPPNYRNTLEAAPPLSYRALREGTAFLLTKDDVRDIAQEAVRLASHDHKSGSFVQREIETWNGEKSRITVTVELIG